MYEEIEEFHKNDSSQNSGHKLEFRRWLILVVFCVFTFTNATGFVTFSPILSVAEDYYNASEQGILWLSNIFFVSYALLAIPTLFLFQWRLDFCLIIGAALNALGGWTRYFSGHSYLGVFTGQLILAISQLFLLPAPVYIAERWFGISERITATGLMLFANVLGLTMGFLASTFVTNAQQLKFYLLIAAICQSIPFLPGLLIFRDKPKYPANSSSSNAKIGMLTTVRLILTSGKNLLITVSLSLYFGISWTLISVIDVLLADYGNTQIALIGLSFNVSGVISGTIATLLLDKSLERGDKPRYDFYIKLLSTISFLAIFSFALALQLSLQDDNKVLIYILCALMGIGFQAFCPIATQSFLENLYPMHEVACFTTFNVIANILGFIGTIVTSINGLGTGGAWMLVGMVVPLYFYLLFGYETNLARFNYEQSKKYDNLDQNNYNKASSLTDGK